MDSFLYAHTHIYIAQHAYNFMIAVFHDLQYIAYNTTTTTAATMMMMMTYFTMPNGVFNE